MAKKRSTGRIDQVTGGSQPHAQGTRGKRPLALIVEDNESQRNALRDIVDRTKYGWDIQTYDGSFEFEDVERWVDYWLSRSPNFEKVCMVLDLIWVRPEDQDNDTVKEAKQNSFLNLLLCPEEMHIRLDEGALTDGLRLIKTLARQIVPNFTIVAVSTFGLDSLKNLARHLGADHTIQKFPTLDRLYPGDSSRREVLKSRYRSKLQAILEEVMQGLMKVELISGLTPTGKVSPDINYAVAERRGGELLVKLNTARHMLNHRDPTTGKPLSLEHEALEQDLVSYFDWLFNYPWYHGKHYLLSRIEGLSKSRARSVLVGENARTNIEQLERIAPLNGNILITGERGTGKSAFAQLIHEFSGRSGSYEEINIMSIPEPLAHGELRGSLPGGYTDARNLAGKLERAGSGTVFIDEIGDASLPIQQALMPFLAGSNFERIGGTEAIRLRARLVFGTNQDFSSLVTSGRMRPEFLDRLMKASPFRFYMAALRERKAEIPELARHFLSQASRTFACGFEFADDALPALMRYDWPGNIRQLEAVIEGSCAALCQLDGGRLITGSLINSRYALALGDTRKAVALPTYNLQELEDLAISQAVSTCQTHDAAIAALGIGKSTFYDKIRKLKLGSGGQTPGGSPVAS